MCCMYIGRLNRDLAPSGSTLEPIKWFDSSVSGRQEGLFSLTLLNRSWARAKASPRERCTCTGTTYCKNMHCTTCKTNVNTRMVCRSTSWLKQVDRRTGQVSNVNRRGQSFRGSTSMLMLPAVKRRTLNRPRDNCASNSYRGWLSWSCLATPG